MPASLYNQLVQRGQIGSHIMVRHAASDELCLLRFGLLLFRQLPDTWLNNPRSTTFGNLEDARQITIHVYDQGTLVLVWREDNLIDQLANNL